MNVVWFLGGLNVGLVIAILAASLIARTEAVRAWRDRAEWQRRSADYWHRRASYWRERANERQVA